ncbi:Molecular co-chaperone STI1 [Phaffia rhodozyma]|uniref:Molecular co-chaperone STI1 n=1 Tax=Phaffia rhodozyma TaxID=264483 RepID=A0A0F7SZ19_PHARH|nr:Molecular co-chaperone STI1 [Phaffia rhodozyma]
MSTAEEFKALGNAAFSKKDYDEAIVQFSKAIELDPKNHVLFSNRSAAYGGKRDYDQALVDAEKTIELNPSFSKGYSRKGSALHGQREYAASIEAYEKGLEVEPTSALLKKGLDEVKKAQEKDEADGSDGIAKMFKDPNMFAKLGANPKTAPFLSDPTFAAKLRMMQVNPQLASDAFQDPRMIQVIGVLMGVDLNAFERPEGSSFDPANPEASEPAPASAPKPKETPAPAPSKPTPAPAKEPEAEPMEVDEDAQAKAEAEASKKKGNETYKARKFEEAIEHYQMAWSVWPKDISFLTNLAAVYFEQGNYDLAIETCQKAVEEGRDIRADYKMMAKAYGRIGTSYQKKEDLENAIKFYNKSLTEHRTPDVLEKLRAVEKQKKDADIAAYIDPEKAEEARNQGNEVFKKGDFAAAVKLYTEATKRSPTDPKAYNNRAAAYTKLAAMPEALKDANHAISLDPTFVKAHIRKSLVLFAMREYTKALEACSAANDADVDHKNQREIENQMRKCYTELEKERQGESEEQTLQRAMRDPEVAAIMQDPVMRNILEQAQSDPRALQEHLKSPLIREKIQKLQAAGVIRMGTR